MGVGQAYRRKSRNIWKKRVPRAVDFIDCSWHSFFLSHSAANSLYRIMGPYDSVPIVWLLSLPQTCCFVARNLQTRIIPVIAEAIDPAPKPLVTNNRKPKTWFAGIGPAGLPAWVARTAA